jgi:hypothetical protein
MIVLGLVVALVAWVVGPSRLAVRIRGMWNNAVGRHSDDTGGAFAAFVARSKMGLRIAGGAVALLVLILWNHPKPVTVLVVAIVYVVYLAVIELIGRSGAAAAPDSAAT